MSTNEADALAEEPLRIAVITYAFAPVLSGIASGTQFRVRRLLERGHYVLLVHPDVSIGYEKTIRTRDVVGIEEFAGHPRFQSFAYPTRPARFRKSHPEPLHHKQWNLQEHLTKFDADAVVVEEPMGLRGIASLGLGGYRKPMGAEYAHATGRPVVAVYHTDWLGFAERNLGRWPTKLIGRIGQRVLTKGPMHYTAKVAPSRYLVDKLSEYGAVEIEHLQCHGTDCREYHPDNCKWDPVPDAKGPVLVNSGRIVPEKSIPVLLDAFAHIQREVPGARMYILGDGEDRERLMAQAKPRFGDALQFPGQFSGERLKGWYARADLYLVASETENFCSANLEALASGTPVIAARAGGNVEQVQHGVNGYLFSPGDAKELAEHTARVLKDDALRSRLSEAARRTALDYDAPVCTDRLLAFVQRLVAESRKQ